MKVKMFFDLETTGFSASSDKIIEIAAVALCEETNTIVGTFNTFVNPGMPIPKLITEITSIKDSDVAAAPTEEVAMEMMKEFVDQFEITQFCGHNIDSMDMPFIRNRNEKFSLDVGEGIETLDTLKYVRSVAKQGLLTGYNFQTATGRPSFKLEYLMSYFGLGSQNHRAIDDVINNITVYTKLKEIEDNGAVLGF